MKTENEKGIVGSVNMEEAGGNVGGSISEDSECKAPPSSSSTVGSGPPGSSSENKLVSWYRINSDWAPPPRQGHSALIIHDRFMITFSGGDGTMFDDLHTFNLITKEWSRKSATGRIPEGMLDYGMDIYGDQIFIFGGIKDNCILSSDLYELDTVSWEWSKLELTPPQNYSPPCARACHTFTVVDGRFYLFGGLTDKTYSEELNEPVLLGDLFVLQLRDKEWCWDVPTTEGYLPYPRISHSAVAYKDTSSKLIIYGGSMGTERLGDVHIFEVDSGTWIQPDLSGRFPKPRSCHSATLIGTRMYVFGGYTHKPLDRIVDPETETCVKAKPECSSALFCLNLETQTWERAKGDDGKFWPQPRAMHSAAGTQSKIYFWGGTTGGKYVDYRSICHDELVVLEVEQPSEAPGKVMYLHQLDENGFVVEWKAVEGADSYILQVCPFPENKTVKKPAVYGPARVEYSTLPATPAPHPQARFRNPTTAPPPSRMPPRLPIVQPKQPRVGTRMPPPTYFQRGTGGPIIQVGTRPLFPQGVATPGSTLPQMLPSRHPMSTWPGGSHEYLVVRNRLRRCYTYYEPDGEGGQAAGRTSTPPPQGLFLPGEAQPRRDRVIINGLAGLADVASGLTPVATTSLSPQQASPAPPVTTTATVDATPHSVNQ
ncbi:Host cell factor 1 [Orchesella cincta]|uniref:Host cell factor 1 n=1 Tax=Orchesella cincta TaxID=48709 RepID=A0A1D2M8U7_ORCCI|nr:Host cell factor 1 [Orchesella cincta]